MADENHETNIQKDIRLEKEYGPLSHFLIRVLKFSGLRDIDLWTIRWLTTCGFFSYLALNLIVGIPRIWQEHTFNLFSIWPFSYEGGYGLKDEILIQTAIAGLMGGIGSVIFCLKELFEMWKMGENKRITEKFAPLLPRPFFGVLLAIIFFFIVRAGMVSSTGTAPPVEGDSKAIDAVTRAATEAVNAANRASAAGIGGLVGIFAVEAMERLKKVAEALFVPEKKEEPK